MDCSSLEEIGKIVFVVMSFGFVYLLIYLMFR